MAIIIVRLMCDVICVPRRWVNARIPLSSLNLQVTIQDVIHLVQS